MKNIKAQVTIFIILAIVIIGGIVAFFALGDKFETSIPQDLRPAYDYYISCLESTTKEGVALLGEQGGYIEPPEFEPGSAYMPFSSQLNFLGQPVQYWMYVSGNNLLREKVPKKQDMENELANYVSERITNCDFSDFEAMGYDVYVEKGTVNSKINDLNINLNIKNKITIFKGEQSIIINNHDLSIKSKLGKFYGMAIDVYNYEKKNMFLEQYALDVMRLYAPVDGSEIGCVPKIFVEENIKNDIVGGLTANIPSIKLDGDYYDLSSKEREYFVSDSGLDINENMNFMYSPDWPTTIEIYGDMVIKPVGLQQGMEIMGFCYTPYHFVYDIKFPVLIQFYDDDEIFQFPIAVVISKNQPREALPTTTGAFIESKVCEFKNQDVDIYTYDIDTNPVESRIQFKCLNSICEIGGTKIEGDDSILRGQLPQCVNGFIIASADGYADSKYQISTNEEDIANIVLNKKYNLSLDLGNVKKALVNFVSDEYSATVLYPQMKSVELIEGYYEVSVSVYDGSSLKFPATNKQECVDIPETGLAGIFGATTEKCYEINIPEMNIDFAVIGGGKTMEYITSEDLENSNELNINVPLFGPPKNLEELQMNNIRIDEEVIFLDFK